MKKVDVRVRPVRRFAVTGFIARSGDNEVGSSSRCFGEFDNESIADMIARALAVDASTPSGGDEPAEVYLNGARFNGEGGTPPSPGSAHAIGDTVIFVPGNIVGKDDFQLGARVKAVTFDEGFGKVLYDVALLMEDGSEYPLPFCGVDSVCVQKAKA